MYGVTKQCAQSLCKLSERDGTWRAPTAMKRCQTYEPLRQQPLLGFDMIYVVVSVWAKGCWKSVSAPFFVQTIEVYNNVLLFGHFVIIFHEKHSSYNPTSNKVTPPVTHESRASYAPADGWVCMGTLNVTGCFLRGFQAPTMPSNPHFANSKLSGTWDFF